MFAYASSQCGIGKGISEDYALVLGAELCNSSTEIQKGRPPFIAAVADGVGGNAGGQEASRFVLSGLRQYDFESSVSEESIRSFLQDINDRLLRFSANVEGKEGMATTLSGVICGTQKVYGFHIGNTRIYSVQGNYLKQLTEDQTTIQWLKTYRDYEMIESYNKNEIIYCMGGGNINLFKGLKVFPIDNLDNIKCLVLTSDGIHDYVDIDNLEYRLCRGEISKEICNDIISLAVQMGSQDDATVVVIKNK